MKTVKAYVTKENKGRHSQAGSTSTRCLYRALYRSTFPEVWLLDLGFVFLAKRESGVSCGVTEKLESKLKQGKNESE